MAKRDLEYFKSLNYKVEISFDAEERRYFARFPELADCMADGASYDEALKNALEVKNDWLEVASESGRTIPLPREEIEQSGRFLARIPKSLHRSLAEEAQRDGVSLNRLVIQLLSEAMERRRLVGAVADVMQNQIKNIAARVLRAVPMARYGQVSGIFGSVERQRTTIVHLGELEASAMQAIQIHRYQTQDVPGPISDEGPERHEVSW